MISEKNTFLVVGSLSCNGFFLKESFHFFDEVYVSNQVPHNEMSALFFAKKPKVILISIDEEASPSLYMYIHEIKKITPHALIVIVFKESTSVKSINALLEMHCDFYTFFQEDKEWIHTYLNDIISAYRHKKEAGIMKHYFQYLLENSVISQTNTEENIPFMNDLFYNITEFESYKQMRKNHQFLRHHSNDDSVYTSMGKTVPNGSIWRHRISNRNKERSTFLANTLIISFVDKVTGNILPFEETQQRLFTKKKG